MYRLQAMATRFNVTYATTMVLRALAAGSRYGFEIADTAGLQTGTVYPALRRLESHGFVTSAWEREAVARGAQRPARRYYQITRSGRAALADAEPRFAALAAAPRKARNA
jgi:DNA-binding PadR family transcriptional regulator